jgi:hypothetical protein
VRISRLSGPFILAFAALLCFPTPVTPAANAGKKAAPKKKAPKPKHHAKHKVKAKAHHGAHKNKASKKKAHPKVKHHSKHHVKPKGHKASNMKPTGKQTPEQQKKVQHARTHARISNRSHEWSKVSRHEHSWYHHHWRTHHFAHFVGGVDGGGGFNFDPGWWNNYVANPGEVNWNDSPQDAPVAVAPVNNPAPPFVKADQSMPFTRDGESLMRKLDSMQVESHWLPHQSVDWKSGVADDPSIRGPESNGGAFVAAVCNEFKLSLPHSELQDFLPGNQIDWFLNIGKEKGWVKVGEVEAQVLANQGWVVVAAWQNMAPAGHRENSGQLAIVRPDREPVSALAERGPLVTLAGPKNRNSIGLKDGFPAGSWSKQEVVYLAHRSR